MDMLSRARAITVMSHPFFGSILLRMKMVPDTTVQTTMTNGEQIRYNPGFIDKLTINKCVGLLAATVMHIVMLHHLRRGAREPRKWNLACDLAIEMVLRKANIDLPQENKIPSGLLGMSAEHIYNELPDFPPGPGQNAGSGQGTPDPQQDPGGNGGVEDSPGTKSGNTERAIQEKAAANAMTAEAAQQARAMGSLPAGISELIEKALRPLIYWPTVVRRFMTDRKPDDFTWSRPNRRHIHQGLYLPSTHIEPSGEIAVFVDTSGSVTRPMLGQFLTEIDAINEDVKPTRLYVVGCDAKVHSFQTFEPGEPIDVKIIGRGGTNFCPPFEYLAERGIFPKCAVYLTDGDGPYPDESTIPYPVLWCLTNEKYRPPFGETVVLR